MAIDRTHLFIGGEWLSPASGSRIDVISATTGLGREFGPEAMASYQQLKSVYLPGSTG
jgi:hypothetical protein